jgi:hypothetical protein
MFQRIIFVYLARHASTVLDGRKDNVAIDRLRETNLAELKHTLL